MEALLERAVGRSAAVSSAKSTETGSVPSDRERSIAVLPFVDISAEKNLAYFCDGVSEEILDALTKVQGLRVIARDSAFTFKDRVHDSRQVGAALNVGSVLEGSARASGGRLRVISRLIDTTDGSQLWSQRFDRQLDDVFAVQDEIAQAVAGALGVRVSRGRSATTTLTSHADSRDLEAYMMCLKGRYCWNQRTEAALQRAAEYFQSAVERDPTYAEAFSGLAEVQTTLGLYGVLPPNEVMPRAKVSATRAIAIDGVLSAPYAVLGCLASVYEWAWHDAENHYRRAIEVNPDHPAAHHWYAINYLVPLKRFGEASEALRRAAAADPLSMAIGVSVGLLSYFAHRFSQADRELRESLALDAGSGTARLFLGLTLAEMARHDEAIQELETALQLSPSPEMRAALAYAFARAGHDDRARQELAELHRISGERYVSPSLVAQVYTGLGETTLALEWLERAGTFARVTWPGCRFDRCSTLSARSRALARWSRRSACDGPRRRRRAGQTFTDSPYREPGPFRAQRAGVARAWPHATRVRRWAPTPRAPRQSPRGSARQRSAGSRCDSDVHPPVRDR